MAKNQIDIQWCIPKLEAEHLWMNTAYYPPESAFKSIIQARDKDVDYFKCPAFQEYLKNVYVIRAPFDLTISIEKNKNGERYIRTHEYDQSFWNTFINPRKGEYSHFYTMSIAIQYLFFSEESVIMEVLPAFMHPSKLQSNIKIIPGCFDISKWIRPTDFAFEVIDESQSIEIKRGDPLLYVNFRTDKSINFIRTDYTTDIFKANQSCVGLKFFVKGNTLKQNYEAAKSYIEVFKSKFFGKKKSKCPFHFFRGDNK
jgi:hypothetical protein